MISLQLVTSFPAETALTFLDTQQKASLCILSHAVFSRLWLDELPNARTHLIVSLEVEVMGITMKIEV